MEVLQVRDTETRDLSPARAGAEVESTCRSLSFGGLFKKVDSTLRGNPGAEVESVLRALGLRLAVMAPAFPEQGRTISGGHLHVRGEKVADIATILRATTSLRVETVTLEELGGFTAGIAVLDAESPADLDAVAAALTEEMLPVGSAGLARALGRTSPNAQAVAPPRCVRVVILAGTANPVLSAQLAALPASPDVVVRAGRDLVALTSGLVELVEGISTAVIATGGETALAACRALGASALWPRGELALGVPWSEIEGRDRTWLVTKAGGFGDSSVLADSVATLLGRHSHG